MHAGVRTPGLPTLHSTQSLLCYKYNRVSLLAAVELHMESGFAFFPTGPAGRLVRQAPWCHGNLRSSGPIVITASCGTCLWAPSRTAGTAAAEALRACAKTFCGEHSPLKTLAGPGASSTRWLSQARIAYATLDTLASSLPVQYAVCASCPWSSTWESGLALFPTGPAGRLRAASTVVPQQPALQRAHSQHNQLWNLLVGAVLHCWNCSG